MRIKTDKEKEAMARVERLLRLLRIKKTTRGYAPLLDVILYAYAYPKEAILDIVEILSKENYYIGVANYAEVQAYHKVTIREDNMLLPAMVRTIETAIERADNMFLAQLGLEKLIILLNENNPDEVEEQLLAELGEEKYGQYTHQERVLIFFVKKILRNMNTQ